MLKCVFAVSLLCLTGMGLGEDSARRAVSPIQTEIVAPLTASRLTLNDKVFTKLTREWNYGACVLPRGSGLVGRVTEVEPWSGSSKLTAVSLLFEVSCGDGAPVPLTWLALLAPDDSDLAGLPGGSPYGTVTFRSGNQGSEMAAGNTRESTTDMSGRQDPNVSVYLEPSPDRAQPRPTAVSTGQVWRVPGLSLSVGTGPLGGSVLSSRKKEFRVPRGAVLVLSPTSLALAPIPGSDAGSTAALHVPSAALHGSGAALVVPRAAPPPGQRGSSADGGMGLEAGSKANVGAGPEARLEASFEASFEAKETCQPPTCSVVGPPGAVTNPVSLETLPLAGLGYRRVHSGELLDFDYGAALAYVGRDRLLFTFNSHKLIPRRAEDGSHPHMVKAVLFNLETSSVEASFDWRTSDDRRYLWPVAGDRVLVHSDGSLRLLGSDLRELKSIAVSPRLAFVSSAPDGRHIAVGVIHELHTPEVHEALGAASSKSPEEEVRVLLLNESLEEVGESRQSSYAMAPMLSDSGRIVLYHAGGERWRYQETSWSGEARTVARVKSACIPEMTTLGTNLLFVSGCDIRTADRWYRVMRSDGSLVLKGTLLFQDMQPLADASADSFAVVLPVARDGYFPGNPFHGADLTSESVRVYSSADGHNILAAKMNEPAPTRQTIAFGPDGSRIAVLDGDAIAVYCVRSSCEGGVPAGSRVSGARIQ